MIRQRIRRWFENRLPRSDSWTLTQRNLYILPTRAGWGFGVNQEVSAAAMDLYAGVRRYEDFDLTVATVGAKIRF
mgnify:CR=1 FL=1